MNYSKADQRYKDIFKRSFDHVIDLFLFDIFTNKKDITLDCTIEKFIEFIDLSNPKTQKQRNTLEIENRQAWQLSKNTDLIKDVISVKDIKTQFDEWYKNNISITKEFEAIYLKTFISKEDFRLIYNEDTYNRKCDYCNMTELDFNHFKEKDLIYTKRYYSRGHTMEVDRKNPNAEYTKDNIVLCCYWCNNAKTDEFTYDEFKVIGESLKQIWQNRFNGIKS